MNALVMAGGQVEPDDPLYAYTNGQPKALIDINGRPMLAYVLEALAGSRYVDQIVVVGLAEGLETSFEKPVAYLPDQGSLIQNVLAGIRWLREREPDVGYLLLASADIPTLTSDIVDDFVASCQPLTCALYYTGVTQATMEARFPQSARTYVRLKGLHVAGGDLVIAHAGLTDSHHDLWAALHQARKHAWKLARLIGIRTLLKFLTRRLSVADIETLGMQIFNRPIRIVLSPHAELAMDADKPAQIELLRRDLAGR